MNQQEEAIKAYAESRQPIEAERKVAKGEYEDLRKQLDELNVSLR